MTLRLLFIAGGIFSLYGLFGILLENLLKGSFCEDENENGEKFTFIMPLLFVATCFNVLYAYVLKSIRHTTTAVAKIPAIYVGLIALTYTLATVTSFMALKWVI
ncbi:hypothetical protein O3M35_010631 [Rhynocoris fuscipes]|uniref:Uncharacterized protein n=1 Tax=Rhynocoris fuscipes TaxID=488301 RepID=A0AAW1D0M3_9HEMI